MDVYLTYFFYGTENSNESNNILELDKLFLDFFSNLPYYSAAERKIKRAFLGLTLNFQVSGPFIHIEYNIHTHTHVSWILCISQDLSKILFSLSLFPGPSFFLINILHSVHHGNAEVFGQKMEKNKKEQ